MKNEKRQITEEIELPNQERIWMFGKKGKLQVLTNIGNGYHQTSGDERKNKNSSDKQENFSKPSSAAEISSKG